MTDRLVVGVRGFDELVEDGVEKGSIILIAGGAGTGKTNFGCQYLYKGAADGEKVLYLSFEESVDQIKKHQQRFGIDFESFERSGKARFVKIDIFTIAKTLQAIFLKERGELMIKEGLPNLMPADFKPDRIVLDSLSALSAILSREQYRYLMFQLFSQFKMIGATTIAIAETRQEPAEYSRTGIEEFLADGVIVLYNIKHGFSRVRALEILKMRGAKHDQRIVPFKITDKGVEVYPKQEIFSA